MQRLREWIPESWLVEVVVAIVSFPAQCRYEGQLSEAAGLVSDCASNIHDSPRKAADEDGVAAFLSIAFRGIQLYRRILQHGDNLKSVVIFVSCLKPGFFETFC